MFKNVSRVKNWLGGTCANCGRATFYDVAYYSFCRGGK